MTNREQAMMNAFRQQSHIHVGLSELVDADFLALKEKGYVTTYGGIGCTTVAHLTEAGHEALALM